MKFNNNENKNSYKFFSNTECEFFPWHKFNKKYLKNFNYLFCHSPLYKLSNCERNFKYLEEQNKVLILRPSWLVKIKRIEKY